MQNPDATTIIVSGPDQPELLSQLTAAFNSLDLIVLSANVNSDSDGRVRGSFTVTDQDDNKVHPSALANLSISECGFLCTDLADAHNMKYGTLFSCIQFPLGPTLREFTTGWVLEEFTGLPALTSMLH